jgi:acyl-CoA thioester hydrolase
VPLADPRKIAFVRSDYALVEPLSTRWADNDVYGHINNVIYYAWFDTAVNRVLMARGLLDPNGSTAIGLVVESGCRYHRALAFPQPVDLGLRIARLGNSSIRWEIGVFSDDAPEAAADGHFVHVNVDPTTRRPQPLPDTWRAKLSDLLSTTGGAL